MKIVAIHAKEGSEARELFNKKVLGMDIVKEKARWEMEKIRLGTTAPPEFLDILRPVFAIDGAIGYLLRKDYLPGVSKIILTIPK